MSNSWRIRLRASGYSEEVEKRFIEAALIKRCQLVPQGSTEKHREAVELNCMGLTLVLCANDLPMIAYSSRAAIPQEVVRNAICRLHHDATTSGGRPRIIHRHWGYSNSQSMKKDGKAVEQNLVDSKQIGLYAQR